MDYYITLIISTEITYPGILISFHMTKPQTRNPSGGSPAGYYREVQHEVFEE